ncbi:MAG: hypothetical protein WBO12_20435, partial [Xanthobacteraceae bacterium]
MPASDNVSYFSRFFLKFVEIIAAGLAAAVSGYLIAHLSGVLSSAGPAPGAAVIQVAPSASAVSSPPAQAISPNTNTSSTPIPVDANDQRVAPGRTIELPRAQPARRTVNATKPEPARKRTDNAPSTAASPSDQSFVSQVRAALTNVDANTDPFEVSPHQPAAIAQPQSGTNTPSTVPPVAASPRQQSPIEFNPPVPVEIKSRPVGDAQSAPATSAGQDTGVLSPLEQI